MTSCIYRFPGLPGLLTGFCRFQVCGESLFGAVSVQGRYFSRKGMGWQMMKTLLLPVAGRIPRHLRPGPEAKQNLSDWSGPAPMGRRSYPQKETMAFPAVEREWILGSFQWLFSALGLVSFRQTHLECQRVNFGLIRLTDRKNEVILLKGEPPRRNNPQLAVTFSIKNRQYIASRGLLDYGSWPVRQGHSCFRPSRAEDSE